MSSFTMGLSPNGVFLTSMMMPVWFFHGWSPLSRTLSLILIGFGIVWPFDFDDFTEDTLPTFGDFDVCDFGATQGAVEFLFLGPLFSPVLWQLVSLWHGWVPLLCVIWVLNVDKYGLLDILHVVHFIFGQRVSLHLHLHDLITSYYPHVFILYFPSYLGI